MRRIALPSVMPKPRSSGSATTVAMRDGSAPGSTSSFSGLISDCQFFWMTERVTSLNESASCARRPRREAQPAPCEPRRSTPARRSDAAALARAAAVMRDRRHVADRGDREADGLQRAQRALAARTRAAAPRSPASPCRARAPSCRRPRRRPARHTGVDLRLPLKPWLPDDDQAMALPCASVMVIIVLLNVAVTCATPEVMFLRSFLRGRAAAAASPWWSSCPVRRAPRCGRATMFGEAAKRGARLTS